MDIRFRENKGFTFIELLVTVGIIIVLTTVVAQILFSTIRSNTKSEVIREVKQNGDIAIDIMSRMMQQSLSVSVPPPASCKDISVTPAVQDSSGSITLTNIDSGSTTFECRMDDAHGVLRIASVSASETQYLTSQNLTLPGVDCNDDPARLQFLCTSVAGKPSTVTLSFSLKQRGDPRNQYEKAQYSFQTTVHMRNSQ